VWRHGGAPACTAPSAGGAEAEPQGWCRQQINPGLRFFFTSIAARPEHDAAQREGGNGDDRSSGSHDSSSRAIHWVHPDQNNARPCKFTLSLNDLCRWLSTNAMDGSSPGPHLPPTPCLYNITRHRRPPPFSPRVRVQTVFRIHWYAVAGAHV